MVLGTKIAVLDKESRVLLFEKKEAKLESRDSNVLLHSPLDVAV